MLRRAPFLFLLCLLSSSVAIAQSTYAKELNPSPSDSLRYHNLAVGILGEGFFRNNEYSSELFTGYTLPGFRLGAELSYAMPILDGVRLMAGAETLYYWGARRYPGAVAYDDVAYWQGDANAKSLHILPRFRVELRPMAHMGLLLGSIEGGAAHRLIEPIYNPELNLTADQETGVQLRWDSPCLFLDAWVDWESFIFKGDNHQEAFTGGISADVRLFGRSEEKKDRSPWSLSLPMAFTAAHRGGEYNFTQSDTVHTWLNAYIGITGKYHLPHLGGVDLALSTYGLGYTQRGEHYASDKGWGSYTKLSAAHKYVLLSAAYWYGRGWVAPHGLPLANSLNAKRELLPCGISQYIQFAGTLRYTWSDCFSAGFSAQLYIHPTLSRQMLSYCLEAYMAVRTEWFVNLIKK